MIPGEGMFLNIFFFLQKMYKLFVFSFFFFSLGYKEPLLAFHQPQQCHGV